MRVGRREGLPNHPTKPLRLPLTERARVAAGLQDELEGRRPFGTHTRGARSSATSSAKARALLGRRKGHPTRRDAHPLHVIFVQRGDLLLGEANLASAHLF